jgi:site-specific recombinase XerD
MAARRAPISLVAAARALPGLSTEQQALLNDMLDGYRAHRGSKRDGADTIKTDEAVIADFLCHAGGIPGQVTPADFERWGDYLFRERKVAESTQRKYQTAVRLFFDYILNEPRYRNRTRHILGGDIVQVATPENMVTHRRDRELERKNMRRSFSEDELHRFFGGLDREIAFAWAGRSKALVVLQRDKVLFSCLLEMGLRADEVLGLDIDSFQPNPDFPQFGRWGMAQVYGKGGKWRTVVVLDPVLAEALEWYVQVVRPVLAKLAPAGERALFLSERGKRLRYSSFHRQFSRARDRAGLPRSLVPHCMRHTSISMDDIGGLSLDSNRRRHGHAFSSTTQGYMHHEDKYTRDDFSRMIRLKLRKK